MLSVQNEYYRPLTEDEKKAIENPETEFATFKDVRVGNPLEFEVDCGARLRDTEKNREFLVIKDKNGIMYLTSSKYIMQNFPNLGWNAHVRVARIKSKTTGHEYLNIFKK